MVFQRHDRKGIVLTFGMVLEGLFVIGIIALLYWFFLSRILEIHMVIDEMTAERHAMNLANVLISSEKLAYEEDGKIQRDVLDSEKLDSIFSTKHDFLSNIKTLLEPKDIGIGYPNTLNLVEVIDLDTCNGQDCDGWIVSLSGPISLEGLSTVKFSDCLADNIKLDVGSIFRYAAGGLAGALWQPWDVEKCVKNTIPANIKSIFTGSFISWKGLPVLIRYPNGDLHTGRIIVALGEWI